MQKRCEGYSKKIDPGIIHSSLDICEELSKIHGKQFNISFNGMLIAQGSKGISDGDVNLWGIEKPVSISKAQKNLEFKVKLAQELEIKITAQNVPMQRIEIKRLLFTLIKRLEQMRRLTGGFLAEQCIEKMKERNPDWKDAFEHILGLILKNTTQIENCISRALDTNLDICHILVEMRQSKCCVPETKFVKLHKQPNYFTLLPTEYLST